jgi:energy-coupling factor transport system permease protein
VNTLVPVYRRQATALHAARASLSALFCCALALVPVLYENPIVLGGALLAVLWAGSLAGVGRQLRRAMWIALGLAALVIVINPLVTSEGLTVLWRGGTFLGRRWDVTLEALTYGAVAALRVVVLVLVFALFSAVVDPDELLRSLRRLSYRAALTVALALRLVPVLARDASRMSDAARCRPEPPGRAAVARSTLGRSLDRAVELAAALEVRGYAGARRPARVPRRWSRHDVSVAVATVLIVVVAVGFKVAGAGWFDPYPTTSMAAGPNELALVVALMLLAAAPLAAPGGRLGVARA